MADAKKARSHAGEITMKWLPGFWLVAFSLLASCSGGGDGPGAVKWSEREIRALQGKSRTEVREMLGKPNGFYTRDAEGRWHYSDLYLDSEGTGKPRRVWVVIYFSQLGEKRVTLVEIHDHLKGEE